MKGGGFEATASKLSINAIVSLPPTPSGLSTALCPSRNFFRAARVSSPKSRRARLWPGSNAAGESRADQPALQQADGRTSRSPAERRGIA
jgi:hypothetical protein